MKLSSHMEGNALGDSFLCPITNLENTKNDQKTLDFLLKKMAIKENQVNNKCVYSIPLKTPNMSSRSKSIDDAKKAFLSGTVNSNSNQHKTKFSMNEQETTLHYAQIAVTNNNEDSRSTGGGTNAKSIKKMNEHSHFDMMADIKNKLDQQRKVSFKIKNANSHRRPPLATKTMTITSNKVSELTSKFNNLIHDSNGSIKPSKLVKTIEDLQNATQRSASNTSTPSSTLSSSPNIKIVFRHRRGSRKRSPRKRCSSVDSIDTIKSDYVDKIRIMRSKSDGTKKPKSPKKRLKYQDVNNSKDSTDSVDGNVTEIKDKNVDCASNSSSVVKNAIKKFECGIHSTNTVPAVVKKESTLNILKNLSEKPKVPEKKVSLLVTKNVVVKDGVAKIKTLKPNNNNNNIESPKSNKRSDEVIMPKKKEPLYDKKKYKTNYIHAEKLSLHVVDIIHEDIDEPPHPSNIDSSTDKEVEKLKVDQDVTSNITPNESFLWRRKSISQIYSDSEISISDGPYSVLNVTADNSVSELDEVESQTLSLTSINETSISNSDFESNLVEAYNKEVLVGFTTKANKEIVVDNDYEPLEPMQLSDNVTVVTATSTVDRKSKINCPLPEIPKEVHSDGADKSKDNIYQCLLEMRSHPEGDESSNHSYELCDNEMEERTRGDGDSDDGYEYCKNAIKPYCHVSSTGLQIAEYQPSLPLKTNIKNYEITKSVSGTSTVSYEKIGSERIYERIPARPNKPKAECSGSRNSTVSSEYTGYNDGENIYDIIKQADNASHCYESIPNSPSLVKLRNNFKTQLATAVQKRLSFDRESNISQSTMSSEQKSNSIYGQRSMLSYNGQEITFPVANSETSSSGRSDRSDDWVDVSDEEKYDEQRIIIVRERGRGRKSPVSWSQKVRHQLNNTPKQTEGDTGDSCHLYESLELPQFDEDFDSFDSDTDSDEPSNEKPVSTPRVAEPADVDLAQLPTPPGGGSGGGPYTLTKIASAAQRKMRELKRNLTKKYSVAVDGKSFSKTSPQTNFADKPKSPIYSNYNKPSPKTTPVYSNVSFPETKTVQNKTDTPIIKINGFKDELKTVIGEKRLSSNSGDIPPPLPKKPPPEKPTTPTTEPSKGKDSGSLSRKNYFSFKSRFRRANSLAVDMSDVPSALKITNSTFYLTDSIDGDSGFSNCSDNIQTSSGSNETLQTGTAVTPAAPQRPTRERRDGRRSRRAESTPCLALERPTIPPPPPPAHAPASTDLGSVDEELKRLLPSLSRKEKSPRTRTSWYAECGADDTVLNTTRPSSTSWYAEAGLYQAGNISSSSGASSGSHPASPLPTSLFTHEPLYQFYNAAKVESVCRESVDSDSDLYEGEGEGESGESGARGARPSAMALVAPARGPARTLWCEVPEVVNSAVLSSLAPTQKRLQEAKFEMLTSEASYLNSLNVLEAHFISHPAFRDSQLISRADRDVLFSTILPVRKCSQLLMNELEKCWQENILLQGLCDIVRRHALEHFHVYVKYCENQALMVKCLQRLRERPAFASRLRQLEAHPACHALSLHSFLMLPMQRVTRLPLLVDAVLRNLNEADEEYQICMDTLATLNNIVSECNEGARNTERVEEMFRLCSAIEFPPSIKDPPNLGPACARRDRRPTRWLVRSGEMTHMVWKTDDQLKLTFGKKFHKVHLHLFLFNDLLVITKKKGAQGFTAVDHCLRPLVEACAAAAGDAAGAKHALLLTLLENCHGRTHEMMMSCPSATDAARWAEALVARGSAGAAEGEAEGEEAVYAGWDCPQVAALYAYCPAQPDELPLAEGDVVNVTRKTSEGWYYGSRMRDGEAGWFPGAYTAEIASPHVRARNLRQRYRLLALSASYRGQRRRPLF